MPVVFLNGTDAQKADFHAAMSYLSATQNGMLLVWELTARDVIISFNTEGKNEYLPSANIISWDSRASLNVWTPNNKVEAISAANVLAHEMHHWLQRFSRTDLDEAWAVDFANSISRELGEPIRVSYNMFFGPNPYTRVDSVTSHTVSGFWKKVEGGVKEFGPLYDPFVKVITETGDGTPPPPDYSGGGGDTPGWTPTYGGGGSSTGGGGGGGTGTVIVIPVNPPPDENPEMVIDPHSVDFTQAPNPVGIVGLPDPIF